MANYRYSTPYGGMGSGPLPPGFMEAATAPGRNLAAGVSALGQGVGKAIEKFKADKDATKAMRSLIKAYAPQMSDQAETMSKSELEGAIKGFVMRQDSEERQAEQGRRSAEESRRAQAFPLEIEARQQGLAEGRRQAESLRAFNELVSQSGGTSPVATAAGALSDPQSGVTLSALRRFAAANPVQSEITPQALLQFAGQAGLLNPAMAVQLAQSENPLARLRAQADAVQAAAYAKQVDTAAAARTQTTPEIHEAGGRQFLRTAQGFEPLSERPFATLRTFTPEGDPVTVPLSEEQFRSRMTDAPLPKFAKGREEESSWLNARQAIQSNPKVRDEVIKRMKAKGYTTEGL